MIASTVRSRYDAGVKVKSNAHRHHACATLRTADRHRVAHGELIGGEPRCGKWMRDIAHLLALAEADHRPEIVGDDTEVIAMIARAVRKK